MTPSPRPTPLTQSRIVTGQVCEEYQGRDNRWHTQVKFEMNKEWVIADFARQLERDRQELMEALREVAEYEDDSTTGPWPHVWALLKRLTSPDSVL